MQRVNKVIIVMMIICVILIAIITALLINEKNKKNNSLGESLKTQVGEVIYDECTDEYEKIQNDIIVTNSNEEKISPNCRLTLIKYYKGCEDKINEYLSVSDDLVNKTKEQLQEKYKEWEIKEFSSNQIVLYKEFEGECTEHYVLEEKDGKIIIYKINSNGKKEEYEKTQIAIDYLPENDKKNIKQGLKINSKEKLNELIESFE